MKPLLASILTAMCLSSGAGAVPVDPSVTYWRGWGIHGSSLYFQVWNPGPKKLCIRNMTFSSDRLIVAAALYMERPLPTDISTWDPTAGVDQGYNAASPNGIDLEQQRTSQGQLRASAGSIQYGGQLWQVRVKPNAYHTFQVRDCLRAGRGVGIRIVPQGGNSRVVLAFGARWTE